MASIGMDRKENGSLCYLPICLRICFQKNCSPMRSFLTVLQEWDSDDIGKILLSLFQRQFVRATIKLFTDPAYSQRIGLNGLFTFSLQF